MSRKSKGGPAGAGPEADLTDAAEARPSEAEAQDAPVTAQEGASGAGGGTEVEVIGADMAAGPAVIVTCLVAAGRRRAGRRWDAGDTRVGPGLLTEAELEELRTDPLLRLREAEAG